MIKKDRLFCSAFFALCLVVSAVSEAWSADMFRETFDAKQQDATIDGVDSWQVYSGNLNNAVIESSISTSGEGKSLEIKNAVVPVTVGRSANYGNLTPAWVEFVLKPGMGNEPTPVPARGIGAVCFDTSGNILVSDGSVWTNSGKQFTSDTWYRVLMKIDFSTHLYDVYISPANTIKIPFLPDKTNLHFIDPAVNSIGLVGFKGVYSATTPGDTYVDEIMVHFMQRLSIISSPYNFVKNRSSGPITFQLQDSNSEPQAAWKDLSFDLYSSSETGQFSLDREDWLSTTQIVIPEGAQQATFYYRDSSEGKPVIGVKESPDQGWVDASQELNVTAEGQSFEISAISPQVAGKAFMVQITAKDEDGQADSFYGGTVDIYAKYINPSTASRELIPNSGEGFAEGVLNLALTYPDCGLIQIVVQDRNDATKKGTSGQILFVPAKFAVTANSAQQIVSRPFSLSITALDDNGQVTSSYLGPVTLEAIPVNPASTSGASLTPVKLEADNFQGGTAEATASYDRWGTVDIEAHDSASPAQKGLVEGVFFGPSGLSIRVEKPAGRDFYYTGEAIEGVLSVLDANDQPIHNFQGPVAVSATPQLALPQALELVPADDGQRSFLFSASAAGNYTLRAEASAYNLSEESEPFQVKQATIEVISGVAPVGTTEVEIQIVDEHGKRITSENQLIIQILFEEEDPNNSLFLSSPGKPILFRNGLAKVVLGNTQAETVTISPDGGSGFKIKAGTVTFGRVGKSGIGTLMLLEPKDDEKKKK